MIEANPVVCVCTSVREDELSQLIHLGITTVEGLREASAANTGCGGCLEDLEMLIEEHAHLQIDG